MNTNLKGLICMAFDGDYVVEKRATFDTVEAAWKHAENMGSRWYFYPFCFVVSKSGKTVIDAPRPHEFLEGKKVECVSKFFEKVSKLPESKNADVDIYLYLLMDNQENV